MSGLREIAEQYLAMRRALGYKLERQGQMLLDFIGHLEHTGVTTVTVDAARAWATRPAGAAPIWWSRRLTVVRGFAAHLKTFDPDCQVPPAGLLPAPGRAASPYLYSLSEVAALIHAAATLTRPSQAAAYQALIGLLAASGLRVGEAVALTRDDVDLDAALLTVRNSKFGKSRLVPLHSTTVEVLRRYAARRDQLCPAPVTDRFFVSTTGTPLLVGSIDGVFTRLLALAGIGTPPGRRRPRVHDLRHSMAVATLRDWYRDGVDVQARLPRLSTLLGHVDPAATFWYLHACPELLTLAAGLLENNSNKEAS